MFHVRRLLTQSSGGSSILPKYLALSSAVKINLSILKNNYSNSHLEKKVESSPSTLIISDNCVKRLKELGKSDQFLRISVDSGGCSGLEYKFLLDAEVAQEDKIIEREGCQILVDNESLAFIQGSTIDYYEELIRQGFRVINNPKSETGCSCGASFSIKI
jgi:iron-sulfur cluster assembly accessory protein